MRITLAILLISAALVLGVPHADAAALKTETKSFHVTLDGDKSFGKVGRFGPFRVTVGCQLNRPVEGNPGLFDDKVRIFVKNVGGGGEWFAGSTKYQEGERVEIDSLIISSGIQAWIQKDEPVISNKTDFISFSTLGRGLHVFDHDCVLKGTVTHIQLEGGS